MQAKDAQTINGEFLSLKIALFYTANDIEKS
jgi:hypothetical protein